MDNQTDGRLRSVETDVAGIKGSLDWAKVCASIIVGVVLAGFALLFAVMWDTRSELNTRIDGISSKIENVLNRLPSVPNK